MPPPYPPRPPNGPQVAQPSPAPGQSPHPAPTPGGGAPVPTPATQQPQQHGIPFGTAPVSTSNPTGTWTAANAAYNASASAAGGGGIPPSAFPTGGFPTGPGTPAAPPATPAAPTGPAPPNMLTPRAGEQYYTDNQQFWTGGPQNSQDFWNQHQADFNQPTNAQAYSDRFSGGGPLPPPNLDPYYERARERTSEDVNRAYGARGMYNSGAALQGLDDAMVDLSAEQANREADYGLQYDASKRAWDALGGQYASQADQSNLQQLMGGATTAATLDSTGLNYANSGADTAFAAQGAERARLQDFFSNIMQPVLASMGVTQEGFMNMLEQDPMLMDQAMAYFTGTAAEGLNQDYRDQEKIKADSDWAVNTFGKVATLGAGM